MKFKVPETISINEITYHFSDCSTAKEALAYLQLIGELQSWDPSIVC